MWVYSFCSNLQWFLSGKDPVADLALNSTGWTGALIYQVRDHVGAGSTPFAVVVLLSRVFTLIRGQVQTAGGRKRSEPVIRRRVRARGQSHGPKCGPSRRPCVCSVKVWRRESGIGRRRKQVSDKSSRCRRQFFGRQHFKIFLQFLFYGQVYQKLPLHIKL